MKKITETFVCDRCGKPLPQEFVKRNAKGETYFDRYRYNCVPYGGKEICFALSVEDDFSSTPELCEECRLMLLKTLVIKLENKFGLHLERREENAAD